MNDINKQTLYRDELGQWFFKGNMIVADEAIFLVLEENSSLITTIESQNVVIDEYQFWIENIGKPAQALIESQKEEIERLEKGMKEYELQAIKNINLYEDQKAITELAVKNLQYYADPSNYGTENLSLYGFIPIDDDGGLMARMTLEVIELRLQNG